MMLDLALDAHCNPVGVFLIGFAEGVPVPIEVYADLRNGLVLYQRGVEADALFKFLRLQEIESSKDLMRKVPNLNELKPVLNTAAGVPALAFPIVPTDKAHNTREDTIYVEPQSHPYNPKPRRLCLRGFKRFTTFDSLFHLYRHIPTLDTAQAVSYPNQNLNRSRPQGLPQQRQHKHCCCCLGLHLYRWTRHSQILTEPPSFVLCQPYAASQQKPTKL